MREDFSDFERRKRAFLNHENVYFEHPFDLPKRLLFALLKPWGFFNILLVDAENKIMNGAQISSSELSKLLVPFSKSHLHARILIVT